MLGFENIEQLRSWLISSGIDTSKWGLGEAKTVENLWAEILAGESRIQDDPPTRVVEVVHMIIRKGKKVLVEGQQNLGQNQLRYRGFPPSEKIKPGESYIDAAMRGLEEELEVQPEKVKILGAPIRDLEEIRESNSYPGLFTKYVVYAVELEIDNLPDDDFWTLESSDNRDDPVTEHQWLWIE